MSKPIDPNRLTRWYNAQARFYSAWRDSYDGEHVRCVAAALDSSRPLRILDAACGTGLFTIGLARHAESWRVEGVDRAAKMLDVGRERAATLGLPNASFGVCDVQAMGFDEGSFDVVVAAGLLPNLNEPGPALREMWRVLRSDGRLFIVEIDREALSFMDRTSFSIMVLGYRTISTVLPRFKFARGWNLQRSTVEPAAVESDLRAAGFAPGTIRRAQKHLIIEACKQA